MRLTETEVRNFPEGTRLILQFTPGRGDMKKLIYRGVTYDYDPTHPPVDDRFDRIRQPITLQYRGNRYQLAPNRLTTEVYQPRSYQLQYRGVKYWVHPTNEQPSAPVAGVEHPKATNRIKPATGLQAVHQANLQHNLEHRIEVARQKGDLGLMAMLELERRQIN